MLWPDDANGFYVGRFHQKGNQITGSTYWGHAGIVNLSILDDKGRYLGFLGGDATTDLKCAQDKCHGIVGGNSAHFTIRHSPSGNVVDKISGVIDFYSVEVTRKTNDLEAYSSGAGSIRLHKSTHDDVWDGQAYYFGKSKIRTFRAQLRSGGSMKNIPDNVLLTLILGAPLAVSSDVAGGVGH